ncbi:molybdopterin guanine dinucleotide biosynthesis accessory protein MobB [Sphaerotilus hippei]|uniref:Molybdopterin guanine dinucleotide biosynthesis accessory protein MobB n=1 Tax=Sphaerotilus hippei TaxID=744406 RepID=A0A318HEN2_9BURK|nr:molybdopterin-guanine dinucleotide biosynthesis protein B [Sphaerotilus hippei]PXW98203.1 molybdopterin guanine dinucleotide biosynthesis accessory protein MobB [Sphaerotilus hippei]
MKVVGLCGASGSGKTTLAEGVITALKAAGCKVSVVKHAHKRFDIDTPGKDSWRHREAGAFEVLVANSRRLALMREHETEHEPDVHQLLAELADLSVLGHEHWVLVEGFKHADLPKIEVWREARPAALLYPVDPYVVAVATTTPLPEPTGLPVLDLDQPATVAAFLRQHAQRYEYLAPDESDPGDAA